jgi:hypothetical protein
MIILVAEEEFLGVDESPLEVFPSLALFLGFCEVIVRNFIIISGGHSAEGCEVKIIEDKLIAFGFFEKSAYAIRSIANFFIYSGAVDELQRLGEVAIGFAFAFASEFACGLAKSFKEEVVDFGL